MSIEVGEKELQGSHKRRLDTRRRLRVESDSSPAAKGVDPLKYSQPLTPPPRKSSWGFSSLNPDEKRASSSIPSRPPLRRKSKRSSLRSQAYPSPAYDPRRYIDVGLARTIMSSPAPPTTTGGGTSLTGPDRDRGHTTATAKHGLPMPGLSGSANGPIGNLLKGPVDDTGKLKDAALLVGIKLDLEAEVHATARVRGDIVVGLY